MKEPPFVHLADKVLEHLFGDREIRDDAILQGADGRQVAGGSPEHFFCFHTDRRDRLGSSARGILMYSDHRGLVEHDTRSAPIDERIGSSEIYRKIVGKEAA